MWQCYGAIWDGQKQTKQRNMTFIVLVFQLLIIYFIYLLMMNTCQWAPLG